MEARHAFTCLNRRTALVVITAEGPPPGPRPGLAPARAVAISGTRNEGNSLGQALFLMLEKNNEALRERGDITCAAGTREADCACRCPRLRRVQIAEAVDFSSSQESQIHAPGLQQRHDTHHVEALGRSEQIWRIGHGVNELRSRCGADHAVFKQADRAWG